MGMAAAIAAAVPAFVPGLLTVAGLIQMSSVQEVDHRAAGKKGNASQKNKRPKKFFHAASSFLCVAVPLGKKWRTPKEGEQECAQRFRYLLCNVLWKMQKPVEAHFTAK